jgi:exo-beta-1,3-glucanase (GH17 family)
MVMVLALGLATDQALAFNTIGVSYGPYHFRGQAPPGSNIPDSQFVADLTQIAYKFGYIKTYGSDPVLARIVPLISQYKLDLEVAVGIYESGTDRIGTIKQINQAIDLAQQYPNIVNMVVVGNECIEGEGYNSTPTPVALNTLIEDLKIVKTALPDTVVTTCLTYQAGKDLTSSLLPFIDNVMVNVYPFYGGVPIEGALDNLEEAYGLFSGHGKPVWIGETGWPSAGKSIGKAVPTLDNEKTFISAVLGAETDLKYEGLYLFEAYDEPWKIIEGRTGPHWGLWNRDGSAKYYKCDGAHPMLDNIDFKLDNAAVKIPPSAEEILDFISNNFDLTPKVSALQKMIEAAGKQIAAGNLKKAYQQLTKAYKKANEFVEGEAALELARMIHDLKTSLDQTTSLASLKKMIEVANAQVAAGNLKKANKQISNAYKKTYYYSYGLVDEDAAAELAQMIQDLKISLPQTTSLSLANSTTYQNPVPPTLLLFGSGLLGLAGLARLRKFRKS